MNTARRRTRHQRGAAALAVTLLLLFVMTLGATFVQRSLIFEQRASANQYAAAQAFEAAEAGLQWAEAQLNANRRLGADCLPVADPAAESFRERHLRFAATTGMLTPRTASLSPGCVRTATGFDCGCPPNGPAGIARPTGDGPFPAFRVSFAAGDRPGVVRVVATGCSSALPPCVGTGSGRADATARIEVALGLLGALRVPPAALLTAGGQVDAPAATFVTAGTAIRAGGSLAVVGRVGDPPSADPVGAPTAPADAWLGTLDADRFFAATFGLDKAHWKAQPVVTRVSCRSDCAEALTEAVRDRGASAMIWLDGDLDLSGPVVLGSAARPVVLVVEGEARLRGAVVIHGALYAGAVDWNDSAPGAGAALHGAVLTERGYGGDAAVAFVDDAAVLGILTRFAGSFARIAGSWRDF